MTATLAAAGDSSYAVSNRGAIYRLAGNRSAPSATQRPAISALERCSETRVRPIPFRG